MKNFHWDLRDQIKGIASGSGFTIAMLGVAVIFILLLALSLFYSMAPNMDMLMVPAL
jgi:hypothetical protein